MCVRGAEGLIPPQDEPQYPICLDLVTVRLCEEGTSATRSEHALQPCRCDWVAQSTVLRCHLPPAVSSNEPTALKCVRGPMPYVQEHDALSASAARYTHEFGLSMLARACVRARVDL